ncbi:MAG: dihydropyrimidinase [Alphaproteobacteria bacterium]|jgi:dihydropyrimidinase|nr:dihydropyrimidinase [Alphaproteobacteria bacterium]
MTELDLVVRNGTVVTATDTVAQDIGVKDGRIVALGRSLPAGGREIDATAKYVLPGGVDSHVHIEQDSTETGAWPGTDFHSTTVSAACGGTTTLIPFVRQTKGQSLRQAVAEYRRRPEGKAVIDYALHLIVTDPTAGVLGQELPALVEDGYTSVKVYMTYASMMLSDYQILEVMAAARRHGAMVMIHAENADCITWLTEKLLESGRTAPKFKGVAHQPAVEREATHRAITLAEIADVEVLIVHVASGEAAEMIRWAQDRGLKVLGETCPQYLFLTEADLDKQGLEGAKCLCAPPPGSPENQEALWQALSAGAFQVYSSDHAAFRHDDPNGKLIEGPATPFHRITNGVPGVETRMPLLFSEALKGERLDLNRFVAVAATNPAKIYGLYPRKGTIEVGSDADFAVWDPARAVTIAIDRLHDGMDYTPYEGQTVQGWPVTTVSRGEVIWHDGTFVGAAGRGQFLPCERPRPARESDLLDDRAIAKD